MTTDTTSEAVNDLARYLVAHSAPNKYLDTLRAVWAERDAARADAESLRTLLRRCADRFERCCVASGSDPEYAEEAVAEYRAALARKDPPR